MPESKQPLPVGVRISLIALEGQQEGIRRQVNFLPAYLGRDESMDVILSGRGVHESHARLLLSDNELILEDLGSVGRTRVNDQEMKRASLHDGDIIELGEVKLLLQYTAPKNTAGTGFGAKTQAASGEVRIWTAGFSDRVREFFTQDLVLDTGIEAETFRTGEEVLIALSQSLSQNQPPDLLILDLRLPLINGINVAIAARAFELGYYSSERIPLVFLFPPPASSGFEKVIKFCQPLKMISPDHGDENAVMTHLRKLADETIARRAGS